MYVRAVHKVVHLFYLYNIYFYKYEVFLLFAALDNAAKNLLDPGKQNIYDLNRSKKACIQQAQRYDRGSYHENIYTRGFEGNY
jgi:hypothetical protein